MLSRILRTNLHFIWVILFFIIHGYAQYYRLIPLSQLLVLTIELFIAGILLFWISTKFLKDKKKSGILTSFILLIILFFGVFQDFFADIRILSVLSYLRLLVIICLFLIVFVYIRLKKAKSDFKKPVIYINSLFLIYLVIDVFSIFYQTLFPATVDKSFAKFKPAGCDSCTAPSVYLIIMDEYLGSEGLKEYFNYDNTNFENFLRGRGFKVIKNTTSNYQNTLFSMASMLNMNYVSKLDEEELSNHYVYKKILSLFKNNEVCDIFQQNGYRVINLSPFEIKNAPGLNSPSEMPQKIQLITSQTMVYRIAKYLPVWLSEMKISKYLKKQQIALADVDNETIKKTLGESRSNNKLPAFVYVHLRMPHVPYVYDSVGNLKVSFKHKPLLREDADSEYLEYLVYTNRKVSQFIAELQTSTKNNAVILLMSDHGYRDASYKDIKFAYQTFSAVFLPNRAHNTWYDGISNVNQFRILFNSLYGQRFPILKDSIVQPGNLNSSP